ncbi:hypothetical protein BLNAU_19380 [Blattamonas nauphoetae]|uniref:Uncharacterized protein n=1 Tax=Blattamonas nauphoetae TaxID=2049346 RepID=A0ABQ9X1P8_9EUKA|nr:hypothetical protein BLNAU_19380 [Blattamonas nauphoetae]
MSATHKNPVLFQDSLDDNFGICLKDVRAPLTLSSIESFFHTHFADSLLWGFWQTEGKIVLPSFGHVYFNRQDVRNSLLRAHHYLDIDGTIVLLFPAHKNRCIQIADDPSVQYDFTLVQNSIHTLLPPEFENKYTVLHDSSLEFTILEFESRELAATAHGILKHSTPFGQIDRVRWLDMKDHFHYDLYLTFDCPLERVAFDGTLSMASELDRLYDIVDRPFQDFYELCYLKTGLSESKRKPRLELHVGVDNWLTGKGHVFFAESKKGEEEASHCLSYLASTPLTFTFGTVKSHTFTMRVEKNGHRQSRSVLRMAPKRQPSVTLSSSSPGLLSTIHATEITHRLPSKPKRRRSSRGASHQTHPATPSQEDAPLLVSPNFFSYTPQPPKAIITFSPVSSPSVLKPTAKAFVPRMSVPHSAPTIKTEFASPVPLIPDRPPSKSSPPLSTTYPLLQLDSQPLTPPPPTSPPILVQPLSDFHIAHPQADPRETSLFPYAVKSDPVFSPDSVYSTFFSEPFFRSPLGEPGFPSTHTQPVQLAQ